MKALVKQANLNRSSFFKIIAVIVVFGFLNCPAAKSVSFYFNGDPAAGPTAPRPNSNAAAAAFDAAAAGLGPNHIITFEDQPIISFTTLKLSNGVTITLNKTDPEESSGITNSNDVRLGYNITSGGTKYLRIVPVTNAETSSVTFSFDTPIQAFGAYLTGLGTANGNLHILFNDGQLQDLSIEGYTNGGVQFAGLISTGNSINSVTMELQNVMGGSRDIFGIDDIRFVSIPEPCSLVFLGLGAAILRKRL